jgi:hypothetical protein
VIASPSPASLVQRAGSALAEALRGHAGGQAVLVDGRIRRAADLLIEGVEQDALPNSLDRTRLNAPQSATALTINSFLPWLREAKLLPLVGRLGFDAIQFEVRCPTGLRGTPPHLDFLGLRDDHAVAVTVRCTEYLSRRKSVVATSYDRFLDQTPGLQPWLEQLQRWRARTIAYRHVDLGALTKYALAIGRTFPDRRATLLYLYWEPTDADAFAEFRRHRAELAALTGALGEARVAFAAQSFAELWQDWAARAQPGWLKNHVDRLRARYAVALASGKPAS